MRSKPSQPRRGVRTPVRPSRAVLSDSEAFGGVMVTYSGLSVNPLELGVGEINIEDIARSLSMQCRFGGHIQQFISVAQHSINVSLNCAEEDALWGLLHDASEAYVCDLPRGLKYTRELYEYRCVEERIQKKVGKRFGLSWPIPEGVKVADNVELLTEAWSFKPEGFFSISEQLYPLQPRKESLISMSPGFAERMFLARFTELMEKGDE